MRWPGAPGARRQVGDIGDVGRQARAAFTAGLADATTDLTWMTDLYVAWAERAGSPSEQAEAAWMRSVVTARESMRHPAHPPGRPPGPAGPDPAARRGPGRPATFLPDALRKRADAYRRQYGQEDRPPPPIVRGGRSFPSGTPSALEAAQAEVARLARAVGAVAGRLDPLDLPRYEVIRDAARRAPVVYLAAAGPEGYALIVRGAGEPGFVRLPGLRLPELGRHIAAFTAPPPLPNLIRGCVEWLAGSALEQLLPEIAADPEIALVPLGALSLLPVNAALLQATAGRPSGPLRVRYLPNARTADSGPPWPAAGRLAASAQVS
jgi:hypothetical protein